MVMGKIIKMIVNLIVLKLTFLNVQNLEVISLSQGKSAELFI